MFAVSRGSQCRKIRWATTRPTPLRASSVAVVPRKSWKRIGRGIAFGHNFMLHFEQRRRSRSFVSSRCPQPLRRQTCEYPATSPARFSARAKTRWNDRLALVKARVSAVRRQSRLRKETAGEEGIHWVGLHAHKKSINVAMLLPEGRQALEWEVPNEPAAVKRLARKLEREAPGEVRCCYEAGPCGYTLQRRVVPPDTSCRGDTAQLITPTTST